MLLLYIYIIYLIEVVEVLEYHGFLMISTTYILALCTALVLEVLGFINV
jgi:hypothetical protein